MRIVALTVGVLWMAAAALGQQPSAAAPDEIFFNGKIVTVNRDFQIQQAFAVQGERFLAVGSNASVRALAAPGTRLTDLRGATVIPGLMDNHNHQYMAAMLERGVDLTAVRSLAEMFEKLRQAAAQAKPGEVILGSANWAEDALAEKRGPTRQELDQVSADHPIVVYRGRGAAYLNSAALKAGGVSRETKFIAGSPVPMDASGEPTGRFTNPPSLVRNIAGRFVPPPSLEEAETRLLEIMREQHAVGLTSIRDLDLRPEPMRAYFSLWRKKKLTMRVSMGLDIVSSDWDKLEEILKPWGVGAGFGDDWLRLDSVSEFALDDGLMREAYLNPPGQFGRMRITADQIRQSMILMNRFGWRPAPHISGDRTVDHVLDAYAAADAESSIRDKRWVMEHVPIVHADQMKRMAELGVAVSAQIHPYGGNEAAVRNLGEARAERQVPMREFLDHGVIVSTGSDWSGGDSNNMFVNIGFYVTRKTRTGKIAGAAQKITRQEALRVATVNNAYLTFQEDVKGSIEPGKLADFLILSKDIMTVPEDEIQTILPLSTFVGGRKVFSGKDGGF
ncbi:MAG: hypothetical protein A3G20_04640 [Acidobacteria bacterium RIFCSPLOWO2_12_FULL_59_11]|nr:MAG: hypothetical protein A3G20_04640 [Acidobacteria bacterium RIFCSPLOWO2_12_FULL_59_11]